MSRSLSIGRSLVFPFFRQMNRWLLTLAPWVPVPHRFLRRALMRDNDHQHASSGWARLRNVSEIGRYSLIQGYCQHFAPNGAVLDVGCGEGILQEGLSYGRYTGIDFVADPIERASHKSDERTRFIQADATTYVPDEALDAIVWNECLYYLSNPIESVERYLSHLRRDGVIIVSMFHQTFATRRLFRQLDRLGPVVADMRISNDDGAAWVVRVYRPHPVLASN